jgi:hypothetical protein
MAGQNTLILASDYNLIQSKIASVMGEGSRTKGYGQTIASSQVGQFSKITASQWNNLRSDVLRARQHQTGQDMTSNVIVASASTTISDAQRAVLLNMAIDAENPVDSEGDLIPVSPPPPTDLARSNLFNEQVRTQKWNGRITQTIDIVWPTANDARYFFNSGGQLKMTVSHANNAAGINLLFNNLASNVGTVVLSAPSSGTANVVGTTYNGITKVGGGGNSPTIAQNTGYYALTTSNVTVFTQTASTGPSGYLSSFIRFIVKSNGTVGLNGDTGNVITIYTIWDEVPDGLTVGTGSTTTMTVTPPEVTNIANTWGTITLTGSVSGS